MVLDNMGGLLVLGLALSAAQSAHSRATATVSVRILDPVVI